MEILDSRTSVGSCDLQTGVIVDGKLHKHIVFREMAGPEEDLLANKKMSVSRKFTNLMSNCIRKFGDIEDRSEINKLVEKMVETDRIFFLIQLRRLSVDDNIEFKTTCPECGTEDKVIFNLDGISILNPPKADALFSEFDLPSGIKVRIRVADAKVEADIEKASNEKNAMSLALFSRITEIDDKPPFLSDVIKLSLRDRKFLRSQIDKLEGEIDDKFTTTCPKCEHEYDGHVPLAGSDFLAI